MNILIADDSKAMRCIVMRALREMGLRGHTFLEAGDGSEALGIAKTQKPDLIFSDLNMPVMSGLEFLRELKRTSLPGHFGFVTSEASAQLQEEAKETGAEFFITKPFTVGKFAETLKPILADLGSGPLFSCDDGAPAPTVLKASVNPKVANLERMLTALLRRRVAVTPAPAMAMPPRPGYVMAEYRREDDGKIMAVGVCDFSYAVRAGAALSLIPAESATEAVTTKQVPETISENAHEVLNVTSRVFDAEGTVRVVLGKVHWPGKPFPVEITSKLAKPLSRIDVHADIEGYGKGALSLLSIAG